MGPAPSSQHKMLYGEKFFLYGATSGRVIFSSGRVIFLISMRRGGVEGGVGGRYRSRPEHFSQNHHGVLCKNFWSPLIIDHILTWLTRQGVSIVYYPN